MSNIQERTNKVVSEFIDTIKDQLSTYLEDKIKSEKFNQFDNEIEKKYIPASRLSFNYLKIFYSRIMRYNNIHHFKLEDVNDEEIIKYFSITDDLYPVFYFETELDKSSLYSINSEISYVFFYNNGSMLKIKDIKRDNKQSRHEIDIDERSNFLISNGKGIVTNKILKLIYKCFGNRCKIDLCSYCMSMYDIEVNKDSFIYSDSINLEILNNKGYVYEMCEKHKNGMRNCNIHYSYMFTKDSNPVVIIDDKFYEYIIRENIDKNDRNSTESVIENIIKEMLNDCNSSKIKEISNDIKLQLYKERENFEEYKISEIEKLNSDINKFLLHSESSLNHINKMSKEIETEHSETLKYNKLKLEEEIRKEISDEYKSRREMENKIFLEEMNREVKSRSINSVKYMFDITNDDEVNCIKLLYENIKTESINERSSNIDYIIDTIIKSYEYDYKNYIYKDIVFNDCYSTLDVIAKYNKTTVRDYLRNYIKDFSDIYLQIIVSHDSNSVEFMKLSNKISKITADVYEYVEA